MIAFTFLAFQVLKWQCSDISVSIVSETDDGNTEVTISVLNTAGSTLLFYENDDMTGKIEYLGENGWEEFCDVSYTFGNVSAVSSQYGGTFAELEPGENWTVSVPDDKVSHMKNGTYRIKMTYITERQYNQYLDKAFENRSQSVEKHPEESFEVSEDIINDSPMKPVADIEKEFSEAVSMEEEFLASNECEVFVKTFEYTAPEDFVGEVSIDDSDIVSENKDSAKVRIVK